MSDEKAVSVYDPDKLMDSVKAKIRAEFTALIPDDAWKNLVKKSVDSFFESKSGYHGKEPSEFDRLVTNLVHEDAKRRIVEYLQGPEWSAQYDAATGKTMMGEAISKIVKENVGEIVSRLLGGAIQDTLARMMSNMQQQRF